MLVLKSLCVEVGWVIEEDGTTYRKGSKPPPIDIVGMSYRGTLYTSQNPSPLSSSFPSPIPSYQVSPSLSSFPSPIRHENNAAPISSKREIFWIPSSGNFQRFAPPLTPRSPSYNLVRPAMLQNSPSSKEQERRSEFEFLKGQVKPWEGERIHEVGMDDLELSAMSGRTEVDRRVRPQ
ncbi:hypothetical protein MLD38_034424 [Melastoma candidum]|uniref:Uncharacterized protein n=1 Tax=Melastoma candidum TaxID=119954 RepID=A0ACB9MB95_9MYRT|nr:hypothetical protein MLD38_034424 [Melastoma candidum]